MNIISKSFDCVQMKWDIQQQLAAEFADIPEAEAQRILDQRVAANPILGPILKQIRVILPFPSPTTSTFGDQAMAK